MNRKLIIGIFLIATFAISAIPTSFHTNTTHASQVVAGTRNARATYSWVFMVYMDGDNNLETAAIDDFNEMSSVGSTSQVAILTLFDRYNGSGGYDGWTDTKLFFVSSGEEPYASNAIADWGEMNMGDPNTLYKFIKWVYANYSATHYALIIWDHGASFIGTAFDDTSSDHLSLSELRSAIEQAENDLGFEFDLIGFDACLMGNIETTYALRGLTKVVVFSEEYEPGDGWPYDSILNYLTSNPTIDPYNFGRTIVQDYIDSYNSWFGDDNVTLSAINESAFWYFVPWLNKFVGYVLRNYASLSTDINNALSNTETFNRGDVYEFQKDLIDFLMELNSSTTDSTLKAIINSVYGKAEDAIIYSDHLSGHPDAYGLSATFKGGYLSTYMNYYRGIEYSSHQQWVELVEKINGYSPDLWLYNASVLGDVDAYGYLDNASVSVDLDSPGDYSVSIQVYGIYNGQEYLIGQASGSISGITSDPIQTRIYPRYSGEYSLMLKVYNNDTGSLIRSFYYGCYPTLMDLKLKAVSDTEPPKITIHSPQNNTIIHAKAVDISLDITDNVGVANVSVYLNSSFYNKYNGAPSSIVVMLPSYGRYNITIVAEDPSGNKAHATLLITAIDTEPPQITIYSPQNYSTITGLNLKINVSMTDDDAIAHVYVYVNSSLKAQYDGSLQTINITLPSYGRYNITIVAEDPSGNKAHATLLITAQSPSGQQNQAPSLGQIGAISRYLGIIVVAVLLIVAFAVLLSKK